MMTHETGWRAPRKIGGRVEMSFPMIDITDDFIDVMMGNEPGTWARLKEDRKQLQEMAAHWAATGRSGYRWAYSAGRGHGKVHAARTFLKWQRERSLAREPAPVVASVRWICKAPTEPVYAKGTNGWLTEQVLARITPAQREYNRKLAKENAAVMDRFAKLLGVEPHGTDD